MNQPTLTENKSANLSTMLVLILVVLAIAQANHLERIFEIRLVKIVFWSLCEGEGVFGFLAFFSKNKIILLQILSYI